MSERGFAGDADAIAIVGAACRLPGGISSLDELWSALESASDLVGDPPRDRFDPDRFYDPDPKRPGKAYSLAGGFLPDIAGFDADYFGISPREAAFMDPQHRLLLELTAEGFDDAALDQQALAGSDTAVFVGVSTGDYGRLLANDLYRDAPAFNGLAQTMAANRISYAFDLRGPSMVVDTACSAGMVAVHQACERLRSGASQVAVAGAVNLLIDPVAFVAECKATMLSPTYRCRAFSADADGFVRAEGGGMVILKSLRTAIADGDRVHAVILASGTNADGHSTGLTVPSAEVQADLLREVYQRAGIEPGEVAYLEAHGTGTPIGDPVECAALGEVFGRRRATPLPIGSIKTNLGHLEAAAGIAGLLKAILIIKHRAIPPSLHSSRLNPEIDFASLRLVPVQHTTAIPQAGRAVVGVNSFGVGGANGHAVLSSCVAAPQAPPPDATVPVMVSARSADALTESIRAMQEHLTHVAGDGFYDLAYTSCRRRTAHRHRALVFAGSPRDAAARFEAVLSGATDVAGARGEATGRAGVAFAFSGNGSQWAGMGVHLMAAHRAFRDTVTAVDDALTPLLGWSVLGELHAASGSSRLADTAVAQPLLFAVQCGLVAVLREQGIVPQAVLGHSVGEVAAAYTAGAYDLDRAARVIAERSKAQACTAGAGRMAAVGLAAEQAEQALAEFSGRLALAAVNSDRDVTISGDADALRALGEKLTADDVFFRELNLDYAFHSHAMDTIEHDLRARLAGVISDDPAIPMISTVTGEPVAAAELDAGYWWRNVREPVRFAAAVAALREHGAGIVVEIGPHPVLGPYLQRLTAADPDLRAVPTLTRGSDGTALAARVSATVAALGSPVDQERYFPVPGHVADLPRYCWQRERLWRGTPELWMRTSGTGRIDHPLLGERMPGPNPTWYGAVEPARTPWVADHRVGGGVVMPATGFVEMALAAGRRAVGETVEIDALRIHRALALPWTSTMDVRVQTEVSAEDGVITVAASHDGDADWATLARGHVRRLRAEPPDSVTEHDEARHEIGGEQFYDMCEQIGLSYRSAFRVVRHLRVGDGEVWADYTFDGSAEGYQVHPALLDGALQAGFPLGQADSAATGRLYLPASIERVRVWQTPPAHGHFRVRARSVTQRQAVWDVVVTDTGGAVAVEMLGCRLQSHPLAPEHGLTQWETTLRAAPRADCPMPPWPLAGPQQLVESAAADLPDDPAKAATRAQRYALLREISAHFMLAAVTQLLPGTTSFAFEDLVAVGVQPKYRPLVDMLVGVACEYGLLEPLNTGGWCVAQPPNVPAALSRAAGYPSWAGVDAFYLWCGRHLPDILCGRQDAMDVVLGDIDTFSYQYDLAPLLGPYNRVVRALVRALVRSWPAQRPLRVLEIGAGTGGTAAFVLPELPAERTQYVFSDVSAEFLRRAQTRFAGYDFVQYRTFDVNHDPAEQGLIPGEFDVVIAANSLHAATDLGAALRRVASVLAPGGHLIAVEWHDARTVALCYGLLDSFWSFADPPLRICSPMPSAARWRALLPECGYSAVATVTDPGSTVDAAESSVLVAAVPADPAPCLVPSPRTSVNSPQRWIVVGDPADPARAESITAALRAAGPDVEYLHLADAGAWVQEAIPGQDAVVLVTGGLGGIEPGTAPEQVAKQVTQYAAVFQAIASAAYEQPEAHIPLWLVTRPSGALPAPERPLVPADAAVWGVSRTMSNEHANVAVHRVSWDDGASPADTVYRVVQELLDPADEDEIVLTPQGRFVPRVRPQRPHTAGPGAGSRLIAHNPGLSYRLSWVEQESPSPGAGQIVVETRAAGLNYRDVMVATGLLPADAEPDEIESERMLGFEFAGVVTAVGPDVTGLRPGDRVFGLAPVSLASHVLARADAVEAIPEGMSFTDAATLAIAWMTAHHALVTLARLRSGDTVLIHGAAGGVGLAAVSLALQRGATVIATAGSELKREFLRAHGVEHVLDSRSMAFADQVIALTGGRGVDVVLHSSSGDTRERSLAALAPFGRFIEIGKRDLYDNARMLMRPLRGNISLFTVDVAPFDPDCYVPALRDAAACIRSGEYGPLPYRTYPAARISEAFRLMQRSAHLGKIVISFDDPVLVERAPGAISLDPAATYLVTGGLGGLGAAAARRLAQRGARHLALTSRRGTLTREARQLVEDLRRGGADVAAHAIDVTDRNAMRELVTRIDHSGHPLRGIIHTAMILDDQPLAGLDERAFHAVLAPKLCGGLILHELTTKHPLEFFAFCSSASALIGNTRQANYVAGNLFLEALTHTRRAQGLPAQTVAWGAIGATGYVARQGMVSRVASYGFHPTSPAQALDAFENLLRDPSVAVTAAGRFDWQRVGEMAPLLTTPRLAPLLPAATTADQYNVTDLVRQVATLPRHDALALVESAVVDLLATTMQTTQERIDRTKSLDLLGIDSLMAMELRTMISKRFRFQISPIELIRSGHNTTVLAEQILTHLEHHQSTDTDNRT